MEHVSSRLTIPARLDYIRPALAYITGLSYQAGFQDDEVKKIRISLEEAIVFTIEESLEGKPDVSFDIRCECDAVGIDFIIQDKGMPLVPERLPAYFPERAMDDPEGLGLFLITQFMDRVRFINKGREGKEWHIRKNLRSRRIESRHPELEHENGKQASPGLPPAVALNQTVRGFRPDDALEVSKCAYRTYGYTYEDFIYYPEKIAAMNRKGLLCSAVAVTDDNKFLGHAALKYDADNDSIAEFGVAFVNPQFRNTGAFHRIFDYLLGKAKEIELAGIYARVVTSHAAAQKGVSEFGFKACGLLLGDFPDDVEFKELVGTVRQKESGLLLFMPLKQKDGIRIYPPEEHRFFIEKIYNQMGVKRKLDKGTGASFKESEEKTHMDCSKVNVLNIVNIKLTRYGGDAFHELNAKLHYYCLERTDVIYLYLDLQNPVTASFADECKKLGFFFAGVLPLGAAGNDALILQYLNNIKIDYGLIKTHTAFSREMLEYVKLHDSSSVAP